ncbi:transcriptional regulator, TetR family [Actinomyces naeslundii str. Howell 279]|uniref:Transcriptional regulator, TetR family n=2 Tax=Actinomyces naeslundii TaxID=1655 RepID=J3JKY0_ACTNH|nr:TetR/AcrR family transcriptional regulator [Actinomyces naeslundii]EJN85711.1 transcriptional regulator, TetR family [Actinomyces naeslundii str. Howell 279]OMG32158.1 TetR family transcriptional regulator [Actinomyces naeslundii]QQC21586.1 TetR/AcrR family transcriptional regulator [Actinomyces naeslundii]
MTGTDLRATQARRTRAAIRAAALALTRERGYEAMTVDDVAALAGVSRRTVFNHFSSKTDLLVVGLEPPEPEAIETFVDGTGSLLEDLGALLASGAEAVESERGWLLSFPEIVRDNPEIERAIHERLRAIAVSLADAAGRRLGTEPYDPRTRAVVALAMAIQRSAVDLWCGRTHPWEQRREEAPVRAEVPEASAQRPEVRLADAVRAMVEALSDVVIQAPSDRPSPVFQTPNPPG